MANKFPISNYEIIKKIFIDLDFAKDKGWFFKAKWKDVVVTNLESNFTIIWENGIWENGTWRWGIWRKGIWKNGTWQHGIWQHGTWKNGLWQQGLWQQGLWENGTWVDGTWKDGKIWNPESREYIKSKLPPNKCKWSLSYGN